MDNKPKTLFHFFLNLSIDFALIFLGWGLDDIPGYFSHPARTLLLLLILIQALFVLSLRLGRNRVPRFHMEHVGLLQLQLIAMETIYVFGPYADRRALGLLPESLRWAGLALYLLGLLLADWAALRWPPRLISADMLNDFPIDSREQRAGTGKDFLSGPFRWVRYPNLLATLLVGLGAALTFRAGHALILVVLALLVILLRIREIERVYLAHYGSAWAGYSKKTKRLIPFLY